MDKIDLFWLGYVLLVIAMIVFYSATKGDE